MGENTLVGLVAWIVGVLVALAVGSGMIQKVLIVPGIPAIITIVAGWVVVVGAVISVILAVFKK
jgi:purine-cytosine permease-like protein